MIFPFGAKILNRASRRIVKARFQRRGQVPPGNIPPADLPPVPPSPPTPLVPSANNGNNGPAAVEAFLNRPWFELGFETGFKYHSNQHYTVQCNSVIAEWRLLLRQSSQEWDSRINEAEIDLLQCGPLSEEKKALAQKTLTWCQDQLKGVQAQLALDPNQDQSSACYSVLRIHSAGYNAGHSKYLLTRGLTA